MPLMPLVLMLLVLLEPRLSLAHETWLLAEDFEPPAGASIRFFMTSGMGFPAEGSGIDRRRIEEAVLLQDETRHRLVPAGGTEGALILTGIPEPGLACAWVRLKPRILEIPDAADVEHYLEEIGAPEAVWSAWRDSGGDTLWRESYSKLARTYLHSTPAVRDQSCLGAESSARFDLLPAVDPTTLAPGDPLEVSVYFDGEPLSGQAIGFLREGGEPQALVRSDKDGRVTLMTEGTGRYMIYATNLRPVTGKDFNWESDFATLTFEVSAP